MRERCAVGELKANPAGVFAMLQWRAHAQAGRGIHVMMSYADALRDVAPWFVQLWAESLGKINADGQHTGPTPVAARGATDQHSQLQLYMEGPADKTVTFLVEREHRADLKLSDAALAPVVEHLRSRTLGELLDAEQRATADALASAGRPSMAIELDVCDAHHVGALMMLLMKATIYAGVLYGVNPLDQPGVELGKRLAREALVTPKRTAADSRWIV
jgi:glucose-6-phosphate isomerase